MKNFVCRNRSLILSTVLLSVFVLIFFFLTQHGVEARAGGGEESSSSGCGVVCSILLFPLIVMYTAFVSWLTKRKIQKAEVVLEQSSRDDFLWSFDELNEQIRKTYMVVQRAWMERDQDIAKQYMTESLYLSHKVKTDDMIERGEKNILENVTFDGFEVLGVKDYINNDRDKITVLISGRMIDYTINDKTEEIIRGSKTDFEEFKEIWVFNRSGDKWLLDKIKSEFMTSELLEINNKKE